jgi:hypothetical protein
LRNLIPASKPWGLLLLLLMMMRLLHSHSRLIDSQTNRRPEVVRLRCLLRSLAPNIPRKKEEAKRIHNGYIVGGYTRTIQLVLSGGQRI